MDERKEQDGYENYEDFDEDDGRERKKDDGIGTGVKVAFGIIVTLIILLSAAIGLVLFGDSFGINVKSLFVQETTAPPTEMPTAVVTTAEPTTQAPTYSVPYVVGMNAKDAYYELNDAGVKYSIKREYSATVKAEVVVRQEPESGFVTGDEPVIVILSKGIDQPDTVPPSTKGKKDDKSETTAPVSGEYLLNNSDKRYIERSEVADMSEKQLTYALNEIYARRGRMFKSEDLQAYFNSKSWYRGTIPPSQFDENSLNKFEKANVQVILGVMREKGYR